MLKPLKKISKRWIFVNPRFLSSPLRPNALLTHSFSMQCIHMHRNKLDWEWSCLSWQSNFNLFDFISRNLLSLDFSNGKTDAGRNRLQAETSLNQTIQLFFTYTYVNVMPVQLQVCWTSLTAKSNQCLWGVSFCKNITLVSLAWLTFDESNSKTFTFPTL